MRWSVVTALLLALLLLAALTISALCYYYQDNCIPRCEPPSIELYPKPGQTVIEGGSAIFQCRLTGGIPLPTLHWSRPNKEPLSSRVEELPNGVLRFDSVTRAEQGQYICSAENEAGSTSAVGTLEVHTIPVVTIHPPGPVVVKTGQKIRLECRASGYPQPQVQWSKHQPGRTFYSSLAVTSQMPQSTIYEISSATVGDEGSYTCLATNDAGPVEERVQVFVVNEGEDGPKHGDIPSTSSIIPTHSGEGVVIEDLEDFSVPVGGYAQMRCIVRGSEHNVFLKWLRRDGQPLPTSHWQREGILYINNAQLSDAGEYSCQGIDPSGSILFHANTQLIVTDLDNIELRIEPSCHEVLVGDTLDLRCIVVGHPSKEVMWHKVDDNFGHNVQVSGSLLRITQANAHNEGVYRCSATVQSGTVDKDYILNVGDKPNRDPESVQAITAAYGQIVVMDCRTDLEPPVHFSWTKHRSVLPAKATVKDEKLTVPNLTYKDAGNYICTISNVNVSVDIPKLITVTGAVPFFAQAPVSYLVLPTLAESYLYFTIEISFKPELPDGLILYNGEARGGGGDFVSIGLRNGIPEFRFDMGSGPAVIRGTPISMGQWHTVQVSRQKKYGSMYVDYEGPFVDTCRKKTYQGLDLLQPLFVGGVPDFKDISKLNGFESGFVGCVSRLVANKVEYDLIQDARHTEGVTNCETCAINPCLNNGVCQEAPTKHGYTCLCPRGFSGENCSSIGEACYPDSRPLNQTYHAVNSHGAPSSGDWPLPTNIYWLLSVVQTLIFLSCRKIDSLPNMCKERTAVNMAIVGYY